MPQGEKQPLRTWALLGARAGDNDQVIALARALELPHEVKQLHYNGLHILGPRLLGDSLASLEPHSRRAILDEPPPDLTISTGHRSVPVVRALRRRSAGRMRSIHVGFPRVSPAHFDLVITTPQYPVPDQPNVLQLPFALTRTATNTRDSALDPDLEGLPGPRRLLIVGGPTLFWNLEPTKVRTKLDQLIEEARQEGGSVVVTTSPRTPPQVGSELKIMLGRSKISALFAAPGQQHSYASLLAAATSIHVTGDSVSMISDAIWTRKPMAVVPITPSPMGSLVLGVHDLLKPGSRIYPQDLRFFWRALAEMGVSEQLAIPRTSAGEVLEKVKRRFRAIPSGSSHSVLTL